MLTISDCIILAFNNNRSLISIFRLPPMCNISECSRTFLLMNHLLPGSHNIMYKGLNLGGRWEGRMAVVQLLGLVVPALAAVEVR